MINLNTNETTKQTAMEVSTSSCETIYRVEGKTLRLWIITGGQPALGFDYSPYEKRYPTIEKWNDKHWKVRENFPRNVIGCYDHQVDQKSIIGPKPDEVLPDGWNTFWAFYNANLPKVQLAIERYHDLQCNGHFLDDLPKKGCIVSKKIRDKEEHTLVTAEIALRPYSLAPVTFSSNAYCGRCDEKVSLFNSWWAKAQKILNPLHDSNKYLWSELSEEEYQSVKYLLAEFKS